MDSCRFLNFGLIVFHSIQKNFITYIKVKELVRTCLGIEIIEIAEVIVTNSENKRRRVIRSQMNQLERSY